jgi:hypothetical protein
MKTSIRVKVSCGNSFIWELFKRQAPNREPVWNNVEFVYSNEIGYFDYWVVLHNEAIKIKEKAFCDPENIIYISMEPTENIGSVRRGFHQQFAKCVLTDPELEMRNIIRENFHTWWVGVGVVNSNRGHQFRGISLGYDEMFNLKIPIGKKNRISILQSKKIMLEGHIKRNIFISKLLASPLSGFIDLYGDDHTPVIDKMDIILPYKYHICLENSNIPNYWTEKLADAFLGYSMPIYYGNKSVQNYFSKDSIILIDIDDPDSSIELIYKAFIENFWEKQIDNIIQSRDDILSKYNILNLLAKLCQLKSVGNQSKVVLYPAYFFRLNLVKRTLKYFYYYFISKSVSSLNLKNLFL